MIDIAFFDIEGTIAHPAGIPKEVTDGLSNLHALGTKTTVISGTGFIRVKELLGVNFSSVVSHGIPIGVENGGRIVADKGKTIISNKFTLPQLKNITILLSKYKIPFVVYYRDYPNKAVIWTFDKKLLEKLINLYSYFAEIKFGDFNAFLDQLEEDRPTEVIFPLNNKKIDFNYDMEFSVNGDFAHLTAVGIDKESAIKSILSLLKIPPDRILIAGNYDNDLPMYNISAQYKLFVGPKSKKMKKFKDIIYCDSIEDLGIFLSNIK